LTTVSQLNQSGSTALTVNATSWITGSVISTNGLALSGTMDLIVTIAATVPAGTITDLGAIQVWLALSEDGTHYTDNDLYSGTNNYMATMIANPNFYGSQFKVYCRASTTAYGIIASVSSQFNVGAMPRAVGLLLENRTGLTLTGPAVTYTPIEFSNA
jgi:hypothetical protein